MHAHNFKTKARNLIMKKNVNINIKKHYYLILQMLIERKFLSIRMFDIKLAWYLLISDVNLKRIFPKVCLHTKLT